MSATYQNCRLMLTSKGTHLAAGYRFISNLLQHAIICEKEGLYIYSGCCIHHPVLHEVSLNQACCYHIFPPKKTRLLSNNCNSLCISLSAFGQTCPNLQGRVFLSSQTSTSSSPGTKGQWWWRNRSIRSSMWRRWWWWTERWWTTTAMKTLQHTFLRCWTWWEKLRNSYTLGLVCVNNKCATF